MTPAGITFRPTRDALDADRQYSLWLRATEGLPFAWASSLVNVRHFASEAAQYPGSRIYAENEQEELLGYVGTMSPFTWDGLGTVVPTGYPWTFPKDEGLAAELYDRLLRALPTVYRESPPSLLLQRFRASWREQHDFMAARGWKEQWREPILARSIQVGSTQGSLELVNAGNLAEVAELAAQDECLPEPPSAESLQQRVNKGWISGDLFWWCPQRGAFALQVRSGQAEVKFFTTRTGAGSDVLNWMSHAARAHGAETLYFTLKNEAAIQRLKDWGFSTADEDVYVSRVIPPGCP